jgi:hypothetical protein
MGNQNSKSAETQQASHQEHHHHHQQQQQLATNHPNEISTTATLKSESATTERRIHEETNTTLSNDNRPRTSLLRRRTTVSSLPSRETVEAHVNAECEELLVKGQVNASDGWESVYEDGEKLKVWRRKVDPKSTAFEYALRGKTTHAPHVFFRTAFFDVENRMKWDESCGEARFLQRCDRTGVETLYWVTKYPWPVTERDYVFHRLVSKNRGAYHAVSWVGSPPSSLSITDYSKPTDTALEQVPKHRVRVVDYRTSMLVKPTPEGGALWCLRVLDDPKVAIVPTSVVNWIVSKTLPSSANKLDKACEHN